jgi:phosphate transport system substrate-binding protein
MRMKITCCAAIVTLSLIGSDDTFAETLKVGGTGAAIGTMKQLGAAFEHLHPEHTVIDVPSLGSTGGIKALRSGAIALAMAGRDLTPDERQGGLQTVRYGTTPFAFASHQGAPAITLSKAKIADIFSGRQPNWSNGRAIRLVIRPKTEGDSELLRHISQQMRLAVDAALERRGMVIAITDTDSADQLENYPDSFGTTTLALVRSEKRHIKLLAVDGVAPSVGALEDGSYPYAKHLYAVTLKDASPGTRQLLQFILSKRGRDILRALGHQTYFAN